MPDEMELDDFTHLATLTSSNGVLVFWWWSDHRKVIVWQESTHTWVMQNDICIRDSIADILDCSASTVDVSNLMMFEGPACRHGFALSEPLAGLFLDCEWSDYACDRRPVMGDVLKKRVVYPRHGGSDWLTGADYSESVESLSDDDTPPSPRKMRRHRYSWK